ADQRDDDECLERLLDERRHIARVEGEIEALEKRAIEEIGNPRDQHAADDRRHYRPQANELVAVEENQGTQEAKHRSEAERWAKDIHYMILRETIHSSPDRVVPLYPTA